MAAVLVVDMTIGTDDIWIYDLERNLRSRFTFDPAADFFPVWSPDARGLYFASNRGGAQGIYRKDIGGAGNVEQILLDERNLSPSSVSPDGKWLLISVAGEGTGQDMSVVPLEGTAEIQPFRHTEFQEDGAVFSPDGRWVAYHLDESGEFEVYVTPFPGPGRRWQVSSASGAYPVWSGDGRQVLFTRMNGVLVSARVRAEGETFEVVGEDELFTMRPPEVGGPYFSISSDAERVLLIPGTDQRADSLLHLLVNWPTALEVETIRRAFVDQKYIDLFERVHPRHDEPAGFHGAARQARRGRGRGCGPRADSPKQLRRSRDRARRKMSDWSLRRRPTTWTARPCRVIWPASRAAGSVRRDRDSREPRPESPYQGRRTTDGARGIPGPALDALSPDGGTPEDEDRAREMIDELDRDATLARMAAAVPFLAGHAESTGKVGAIGACWGGGLANQLAAAGTVSTPACPTTAARSRSKMCRTSRRPCVSSTPASTSASTQASPTRRRRKATASPTRSTFTRARTTPSTTTPTTPATTRGGRFGLGPDG